MLLSITSPRRCLLGALLALCLPATAASAAKLTGPIRAPAPAPRRDIPRDIVRIAQAEYAKGIREVPMGSNNSREISRYRSALIPHARGGAWCVYFTSWVTRRAGAPIGPGGAGLAGAAGVASWAIRTGRWRRLPKPGDIAVYPGHAGIVAAVRGSHMITIEGNWSDRVSRLYRSRYEAIGFARVAAGDHPTPRR